MNICCILLPLLVLLHPQIVLYSFADLTLLDASNLDSEENTQLVPVFNYILETHPELQSYVIASLSKDTTPPTNNSDYYIIVRSNDTNVMIAVTVSTDSSFFVSYNKIPSGTNPNTTTPFPSQNSSTVPQAILQSQNNQLPNNSSQQPLGGYHKLNNLKDNKFKRVLQLLNQQHPHLLNYQLLAAYYQVVSGINYLIRYKGIDRITAVQARVHYSLDAELTLTQFTVTCAAKTNLATVCSDDKAGKIYSGCELSITTHPELLDYKLVSIFTQEQLRSSLIFMVTFQNEALKLRAISEISVSDTNSKILSYYSYNYGSA